MTAKAKHNRSAKQTGKARPGPIRTKMVSRELRDTYGLSRPVLARMLGVTEATLGRWEKGTTTPGAAGLEKVKRLGGILEGLARVMKKSFIPTWLASPNDACKGRTPVDLLEEGQYETIEDMVYFLEAGEPV
jgi:transcriptional regulator with XRE-family HTH domain